MYFNYNTSIKMSEKELNKETDNVLDVKINENIKNSKQITYIDLCCGIGSFHYSFLKKNWKCIMACDIDDKVLNLFADDNLMILRLFIFYLL